MTIKQCLTWMYLGGLAGALGVCAGCTENSPSSRVRNVPDEASYVQSLVMSAKEQGDHFVIEYGRAMEHDMEPEESERYWEVIRLFAILDDREVHIGTDAGVYQGGSGAWSLGKDSPALGGEPETVVFEIRFEVWEGNPDSGTLLFAGRKTSLPIHMGSEQ